MSAQVHVVATGSRTPLGLRCAASAAAFRAGINRLREHPDWLDRLGNPMVAALDAELPAELPQPARLLELARTALVAACEPFTALTWGQKLPLYLALAEQRPGFAASDAAELVGKLRRSPELPVQIDAVHTFGQGHAAGALALAGAVAALGRAEPAMCIVGGVESYFHRHTMEWLDENRQLAGADGRSSFVPGEGAGFLLLANASAQRQHNLRPLAVLTGFGSATEQALIKTDALCLGQGLTAAVDAACAGARISNIYCDINGERYRAQEWGFVCLRLATHFDDPLRYHAPARSWGDMGAASIPLFAMLACHAAQRGHDQGKTTMLWASSEGGLRGAVVLETARNYHG